MASKRGRVLSSVYGIRHISSVEMAGFTWEECTSPASIWEFWYSGSILLLPNDEEADGSIFLFSTDERAYWARSIHSQMRRSGVGLSLPVPIYQSEVYDSEVGTQYPAGLLASVAVQY